VPRSPLRSTKGFRDLGHRLGRRLNRRGWRRPAVAAGLATAAARVPVGKLIDWLLRFQRDDDEVGYSSSIRSPTPPRSANRHGDVSREARRGSRGRGPGPPKLGQGGRQHPCLVRHPLRKEACGVRSRAVARFTPEVGTQHSHPLPRPWEERIMTISSTQTTACPAWCRTRGSGFLCP